MINNYSTLKIPAFFAKGIKIVFAKSIKIAISLSKKYFKMNCCVPQCKRTYCSSFSSKKENKNKKKLSKLVKS